VTTVTPASFDSYTEKVVLNQLSLNTALTRCQHLSKLPSYGSVEIQMFIMPPPRGALSDDAV